MAVLSEYVLEPLREGGEFTLYRGRQHDNPTQVLAVARAAEQPSPQSVLRLKHEYSLAIELDAAWRLLEAGSYSTVSFKFISELRGVTVTN
jgi:hypothetical protein